MGYKMSTQLMIELWEEIKPVIPPKERLHVADKLVQMFDDYGLTDDIHIHSGSDSTLIAAIASYHELGESNDHDERDDW